MLCVAALLLGFSADAGDVPPDPAVAHANATRAGPIGYRQGWFGEGDNRLHYVEAGTGPLVILVHGFPSFWYSWFDQMEVLKDRYRVVAIDALGAGLSARPAGLEAYRVDALAAGIDALARSLSLNAGDPPDSRFVLIGHDWGAALAFAFAQARPERLHAVVGLNAPPYNQFLDLLQESPDQQARSDYMQAFRKLAPGSADEALARRVWQQSYAELSATGRLLGAEMALFGEALSRPGALNGGMNWYRANIPALEDLARQPRWPAGGTRLTLPAMLIWGGRDTAFTDEAVARTAAISDQLSIVRLPATGHWAGIETPTAVNTALVDFLAKLRSTAGTR
jgi:pimeloyl-ACP methyl ester carboxylesterase